MPNLLYAHHRRLTAKQHTSRLMVLDATMLRRLTHTRTGTKQRWQDDNKRLAFPWHLHF